MLLTSRFSRFGLSYVHVVNRYLDSTLDYWTSRSSGPPFPQRCGLYDALTRRRELNRGLVKIIQYHDIRELGEVEVSLEHQHLNPTNHRAEEPAGIEFYTSSSLTHVVIAGLTSTPIFNADLC